MPNQILCQTKRIFLFASLLGGAALSLWPQSPLHAAAGPLAGEDTFPYEVDHETKREPYLPKPSLCESFTDPVFGTTITRLTDHEEMGYPGIVNEYSKAQPWNADASLLLVRSTNAHWLLIGSDCQLLQEMPFEGSAEPRWSPHDPQILRFISKNQIREMNVATGEITTLHTFSEYDSVSASGEGNWSADFDLIALLGYRGGSVQDAFVYRASDDRVFEKLRLAGNLPGGLDWITITPYSEQVIILFGENDTWKSRGSSGRRLGFGMDIFDKHMKNRRRVQDHVHHGDVCLTEDGEEAFVGSAANAPDADKHRIRLTRLSDALPLSSSGTQDAPFVYTSLLVLDWFLGVHVSCRNIDEPGWVYVSTYGSQSPEEVPFAGELFALATDGSGDVRRLAHLRAETDAYFEEPHAVARADGRAFLFTSNWRKNAGEEKVDVYQVSLPPLAGSPGGMEAMSAEDAEIGCAVATPGQKGAGGAMLLGAVLCGGLLAKRYVKK